MTKKNITELIIVILTITVVMIYSYYEIKSKKLEQKCSETARQGTANLVQAFEASNMQYDIDETYKQLFELCIEENK